MEQSRIRQHPERAVPEEASAILTAGLCAHVGFVEDGQPYVIPFSYYYDSTDPHVLYLHGSSRSRTLERLAEGLPVCVAVTILDGLVYSRSAKYHSMNYRSVVCFGRAGPILNGNEKQRIFRKQVQKYFPGRESGVDYAEASEDELAATGMVAVNIEEWSAKARSGGPMGPFDASETAFGTRGVVPLRDGAL